MQAKKGPNILFLMSDQHRWDALGIHNPIIKTPNLDKLAQDGILFENAFCNAPLCVPSRYSMMTGLYPSQCGIRNNSQQCLSDESLPWAVLPQRLKALGYKTGGFGKTHWYNQFSSQSGQISSTRGFDVRAQHFWLCSQCGGTGSY
jgi:arylsulfatase